MSESIASVLELDDIDVLMEALEAWESKDAAGELMASLVGAMIAGKDSEAQAKLKEDQMERANRAAAERALRKERSILLRSRLLKLRDRIRAAQGGAA